MSTTRIINKTSQFMFGASSTATKILFGIIDACSPIRFYTNQCLYTYNVINLNILVTKMCDAIKKIIDYSRYQKLDTKSKDDIRHLIIEELGKAAENYQAEERRYGIHQPINIIGSYIDPNSEAYNSEDDTRFKKGLQVWRANLIMVSHRGWTGIGIHFPPELFHDCDLLKKHIFASIHEKYANILLPNANFTILSKESKKSISTVKRNTLMTVQLQRLNPLFAQLPDEVCSYIASLTSEVTKEVSRDELSEIANNNFIKRPCL